MQRDAIMTVPLAWWNILVLSKRGHWHPCIFCHSRRSMCACDYLMADATDAHGHHSHACNQRSRTTRDAHAHIVSALENICQQRHLTTIRGRVTSSRGRKKGEFADSQYLLCRQTPPCSQDAPYLFYIYFRCRAFTNNNLPKSASTHRQLHPCAGAHTRDSSCHTGKNARS